jgi:hypothetical protein
MARFAKERFRDAPKKTNVGGFSLPFATGKPEGIIPSKDIHRKVCNVDVEGVLRGMAVSLPRN